MKKRHENEANSTAPLHGIFPWKRENWGTEGVKRWIWMSRLLFRVIVRKGGPIPPDSCCLPSPRRTVGWILDLETRGRRHNELDGKTIGLERK